MMAGLGPLTRAHMHRHHTPSVQLHTEYFPAFAVQAPGVRRALYLWPWPGFHLCRRLHSTQEVTQDSWGIMVRMCASDLCGVSDLSKVISPCSPLRALPSLGHMGMVQGGNWAPGSEGCEQARLL